MRKLSTALIIACAHIHGLSQADENLMFDDVKFELQTSTIQKLSKSESRKQTYKAVSDSKHSCSLVASFTKASDINSYLMVDKMVFKPPVTLEPLEIVGRNNEKDNKDATSVILLRDTKDSAKYIVAFHRVTEYSPGEIRELHIQCTNFSFDGLFSKGMGEFKAVKAKFLLDAFALSPLPQTEN